jgi:hypothetical protein
MNILFYRLLLSIHIGVFAVGMSPARADDADMVKEKLFQAKKEYDAEVQKFKKSVTELLDKREDTARNSGNKKVVDQIKAERDAFERTGELPSTVPASLREPLTAVRVKLDKTYAAVIKDYVRLKMDDAAGAAEKERLGFHLDSAAAFGKRTYLSAIAPSDVRVWGDTFEKDSARYKMNGTPVPHSIFMHPFVRSDSTVSYVLPPKAAVFRASVGVPKWDNNVDDPATALTFEVLGDGKSLWKSEPIAKRDTFQTCTLSLEKVKKLTLRVNCPGELANAHAVWFAPYVAE